jgi:hypothetical protein
MRSELQRDELKEHFTLQIRLRELCDVAGIERPLSERELEIGLLALQACPPSKDRGFDGMDLSLAL